MNIIKFGRYERDGLRLIKWIEWTIADKTNGLNFGMWTQGDEIKTTEGSMEIQTRCWKKIATPKKQKMEFNLDNKKQTDEAVFKKKTDKIHHLCFTL